MNVLNPFRAGHVFRGHGKACAGCSQPLRKAGFAGKLMGELGVFRQQTGVSACRRGSLFIPLKRSQTILDAFMIEVFQDAFFRRRDRLRVGTKGGRGSQQEDNSAIQCKLHRRRLTQKNAATTQNFENPVLPPVCRHTPMFIRSTALSAVNFFRSPGSVPGSDNENTRRPVAPGMFWISLLVFMSWAQAAFFMRGSMLTSTGRRPCVRRAWLKPLTIASRNCFSVYETSVCAKSCVTNSSRSRSTMEMPMAL